MAVVVDEGIEWQKRRPGILWAILVITVAAVQLIGDALVRLTTPHRRLSSAAARPLRRRAPAV
jgi:hypothetical protein